MEENSKTTEPQALSAPPELNLDVDDDKLIAFINTYRDRNKKRFEGKKLNERRKTNERFYFGRQIENGTYEGIDSKMKIPGYETPVVDNIIKEGMDKQRPLVLSRLPEFIVKPGTEGDESSEQNSEGISKIVNKALTAKEIKRLLNVAYKHHGVNFIGVIKYRWNPEKGKYGDIDFEVIHPDDIDIDMTATENNERAMKVIIHYVRHSLKDWIGLFPDKEDELKEFAKKSEGYDEADPDSEKSLAVELKLEEVWFDWQEKAKDYDKEDPKFEKKVGVLWKTDEKLLKKRLNPNWDWEGEEKMFFEGEPIPDDLLAQVLALQAQGEEIPGITKEQVYRNFFGKPRKPFIFLGYEQWGKMPYDETTMVEENLYLQQNYDKRRMQITKMIDDSRGKHVFSSVGGVKKKTLEEMDLNDPNEDIFTDGDLRQVHAFITKEQPSAQMFKDEQDSKDRILARMHVGGATGGEIESDVATTNQIQRESSFMIADDISDIMIDDVATQMAEALMHMMKLRYTQEHFKAVLGKKGFETFFQFKNDIIEDGMEIEIFASGTDKLKAERQAKEEAQLGLIDPLTYYKDTGRSDPEGRAKKLFLSQSAPELYFKQYIEGEDVPGIAEQVMLANQQKLAGAQGGQPAGGGNVANPNVQQPSAANTGNIPTTPGGSPRNLIGQATQRVGGAVNALMGR